MKTTILRAESLIPHRRHMKLLDRIVNPAHKELQAETTVAESWPLAKDGSVSSLICIELVAQAISALSTWRRGEEARPRVGLLVGIKEAEFFALSLPLGTGLTIHIEELYHVGDYAVFKGRVISGSALLCTTVIQVMEPEGDDFPDFLRLQGTRPDGKERRD